MRILRKDLLEIVMRRYERASTIVTSSRPVEDGATCLGMRAAVNAMLDRLLHHEHLLKCGRAFGAPKRNFPPSNYGCGLGCRQPKA